MPRACRSRGDAATRRDLVIRWVLSAASLTYGPSVHRVRLIAASITLVAALLAVSSALSFAAPRESAAPVQPEVGAVSRAGATAFAVKPRAVVSGSSLHLQSGQLRVSVKSNARRVRLTWRTAANRTRSTTVRIREGAGTATLAGGSSRVVARALATPRLRPSVRLRLRSNPWLSDMDGNGIVNFSYDMDSDGRYEAILFDDDRNGRFEVIFLDAGTTSGLIKDANQDGYFETVALDADRNSRLERLFYDGDGDGYPEWQCLDLVGPDGLADTWVDTRVPSGNLQQDRAANDLMVENIVRMNQLRQLDPWSTGYIPYSPAPSLLRPYDQTRGRPDTPYPVPSS